MSVISFQYEAMDGSGARTHGQVKGASRSEVFRQLVSQGLTPVRIRSGTSASAGESSVRSRRGAKIKLRDLSQFTHQLGVLVGSGVPISQSLRGLAEQEAPGPWKSTILDVTRKIEAGSRIASAMGDHPRTFDRLYVSTVHAAEESGTLPKVLEYLSELLERDAETRQQLKSALMYPVIVLVVLGLAVTFLVGFIVPKFAKMFEDRGVELPIYTRIVMGAGQSVQEYWYVYLAAIIAATFGLRAAWTRPSLRVKLDGLFHRVPYLKKLLIAVAVSRFTRVMGLCLNSRLSLIDSFEHAGKACGRPMLDLDAQSMGEQVRRGSTMSQVVGSSVYLPPMARRMLLSGAETGELVKMCQVVAKQYERDAMVLTKNVTTVIEPVLIVLIAGVVLTVALAIFMPMWELIKVMQ